MRVVVSLTTLPSRVAHLAQVLDSLRAQTFAIDAIYLNIPSFSKREKCAYDLSSLPANVLAGVTVLSGQPDDGPITKLLPALDAEPVSDKTYIVLVDDDIAYHPRCLEDMMRFAEPSLSYAAFGATGRTAFRNSPRSSSIAAVPCHVALLKPRSVIFLETWSMAVYRRDVFPESASIVRDWMRTLPAEAFFVDDIVISAWMDRFGGAKRWLVPVHWLPSARARLRPSQLPNPLSRENTGARGRNLKVLNELYSELGYFQDNVRCLSQDVGKLVLAILLVLGVVFLVTRGLRKSKQ